MASIRAGIGGGLCHLPQDLGSAWTAKPQRSEAFLLGAERPPNLVGIQGW